MFGPYFVNYSEALGWYVAHTDAPHAVEYGPWPTEAEACKFLQENYKGE